MKSFFYLNFDSFNVLSLFSIIYKYFMSIINSNFYLVSLTTANSIQFPKTSEMAFADIFNTSSTILNDGFFFFHSALFLSCFVMMLGFFGIIFGGLNLIFILIGVELMILSIISLFITISAFTINPYGELNSLFLIGTAASESVLVLAVLIRMAYFDKTVVLRDSKYSVRG